MAFAHTQVINTPSALTIMPILTLTTDWGLRDHYTASFKGTLVTALPTIHIIDISHDIEKFNIMNGAFVVQNSFLKFPTGSIHFVGITGNENNENEAPFVLIRSNGHYLIGEDNGVFALILGKKEKEIRRFPWKAKMERNELMNSLNEVLVKLINGTPFESLGEADNKLKDSFFAIPTIDKNSIRGSIIFIDSFGNAIVNITKDIFYREQNGRKLTIYFRKSLYNVTRISKSYEDVESGEMLAFFNEDGYLEIALNRESATKLLGLKLMDPIQLEFNDYPNS